VRVIDAGPEFMVWVVVCSIFYYIMYWVLECAINPSYRARRWESVCVSVCLCVSLHFCSFFTDNQKKTPLPCRITKSHCADPSKQQNQNQNQTI
jgi:glucan phosphoethanolaminetransferase (alkaline phosphatase superfamily)